MNTQGFCRLLLCCAVAAIGSWTLAAEKEIDGFTVIGVQARGFYRDGDKYMPIKVDQRYPFGTQVKTGRRSTVDMEFSPGNTFRLMPRSRLTIETDTRNPKLKVLRLDQGTVKVKLDKFPKDQKLQVETPTAVCGALGTRFVVAFEDDENEEKAAAKANTRENRISCEKGEIYASSRFTIEGNEVEGETFTAPNIGKGTEIVAIVHEGLENSYTDISVNRGTVTMEYGVEDGGSLSVTGDEGKPGRFICALEKSDDEVKAAALTVKSGTVKHRARKGFFVKKEVETEVKPDDGAVVVLDKQVMVPPAENTLAANYLDAAREEGELHSAYIDKVTAGTATDADQDALATAAAKATNLRQQLLAKRTIKMLQQIRRGARRMPRMRR